MLRPLGTPRPDGRPLRARSAPASGLSGPRSAPTDRARSAVHAGNVGDGSVEKTWTARMGSTSASSHGSTARPRPARPAHLVGSHVTSSASSTGRTWSARRRGRRGVHAGTSSHVHQLDRRTVASSTARRLDGSTRSGSRRTWSARTSPARPAHLVGSHGSTSASSIGAPGRPRARPARPGAPGRLDGAAVAVFALATSAARHFAQLAALQLLGSQLLTTHHLHARSRGQLLGRGAARLGRFITVRRI